MSDDYDKAIDQAVSEYKGLYRDKMKFVKQVSVRAELVKAVSMRARDIYREKASFSEVQFTFHLVAYDFENMIWVKCPGCGSPDIQKETDGTPWKGCYTCRVLLDDKNALIRSMKRGGKKAVKEEPFGAKVEAKHD